MPGRLLLLFFVSLLSISSIGIAEPQPQSSVNESASFQADEIVIFYQGVSENLQKIQQQLERQLNIRMPDASIRFIDLAGKNRRDVEKYLMNTNRCAMGIGPYATQKMLTARKQIPYFSLLTSRNLLDKLHNVYRPLGIPVTGIYEEQPFERQLLLAKAMSPSLSTVGVLLDQQDKYFLEEYQFNAEKQAITLEYRILSTADTPEKFLSEVTPQSGYMLLTNNNQLYMKSKLAALVLSAYYQRIKLIGNRFEDAHTGTVASIYTPMTTLVIEASNEFKSICDSGKITQPRFAKSFSVIINRQIAENLNLGEFDVNRLSKQITQMENLR